MKKSSKKTLIAGAAGLVLAASGALPAFAAPVSAGGGLSTRTPVGSVFSGIVEATSNGAFLVSRRQGKSGTALVSVDTDYGTVASRGGLSVPVGAIQAGTEVIVSGTRTTDGAVLASKIIVRA